MPAHPHDRLFRRTFSNPVHAAAELRAVLPAALVTALDLGALETVPGSFVDPELAERQVDLLYTVPLRDGGERAFVYVLFEHQSSVDRRMPARLLVYMAGIWDRWMRENPGAAKLPLVVPVVLHHSATGWTAPTRFSEVLAVPDDLRAVLGDATLDFEFTLDDLSHSTEQELHGRAQMAASARLVLSLLRLGRTGQPEDIGRWARLLLDTVREPEGIRAFQTVLRYLAEVRDDDFTDVLVQATNDRDVEAIAMTYKERLIEQGRDEGLERGREEGLEQGREQGRAEGSRLMLAKLLQLKFGPLDDATEAKLAGATLGQLEAWSERVLTAESLDAVFAR